MGKVTCISRSERSFITTGDPRGVASLKLCGFAISQEGEENERNR